MEQAPWMVIQLGTHKSNKDLRQDIEGNDHRISDWGSNLLKRIDIASEPVEVDLIVLSIAELGFLNGCTIDEIYKAAQKLELELCPAEVGPQLRLQYNDQPMDECLLVAMEPVVYSSGNQKGVFRVGRSDIGSWLGGDSGNFDHHSRVHNRWVFIRPK